MSSHFGACAMEHLDADQSNFHGRDCSAYRGELRTSISSDGTMGSHESICKASSGHRSSCLALCYWSKLFLYEVTATAEFVLLLLFKLFIFYIAILK